MEKQDNEKLFFRLLYILKRHTDSWADSQFNNTLNGFKSVYIPVMLCIDDNGISNNGIAQELHISKMAASKVVKELVKLELVTREKDVKDGRSERLYLTEKGKDSLIQVKSLSMKLINEYESVLGKHNYQQMIDSLTAIRAYHESNSF